MANQYHDELGRFCSRTEMGQAVDRVFNAAANAPTEGERKELMQQWISIKNDYDTAVAKPETFDEKIKSFLSGEEYNAPSTDFDQLRMASILLSTEPVQDKGAKFQELLGKVNFSKIHPYSADLKNVLSSKYVSDDQAFEIAQQVRGVRAPDAGLVALATTRYSVFANDPAKEARLVKALQASDKTDSTVTQAWVRVASRSASIEHRTAVAEAMADDKLYYTHKQPIAALASNPHLTLPEGTALLTSVAAHSPDSWFACVNGLAESSSASLKLLREDKRIAEAAAAKRSDRVNVPAHEDYKSDEQFAHTWQLNGFELAEQRERAAKLEADGLAAANKMSGYGSPETPYEGMTFEQRAEYSVLQARVDANDLAALRKEKRQLRGAADGFFNRGKSYSEKQKIRARYTEVIDRIADAQRYIYRNETAAAAVAKINHRAMILEDAYRAALTGV